MNALPKRIPRNKRWKYSAAAFLDRILGILARLDLVGPTRKTPDLTLPPEPKILLLSLDRLGDAVMDTAAVQALKDALPSAHLTVLARPATGPIFWEHPAVDRLWTTPVPWWEDPASSGLLMPGWWEAWWGTLQQIRREHFDAVLDLRGDPRHLLLYGALGKPTLLLGHTDKGGAPLVSAPSTLPAGDPPHQIDRKLALLETLGLRPGTRPRPQVHLTQEERDRAREFLGGGRLVWLDPGGKPVQRWPAERWIQVARTLSSTHKVLVSTAPGQEHLGTLFQGFRILEPAPTLRDLAARLSHCDLVLSVDTGVAHLAAAVGTRTLTLYGPTSPEQFSTARPGSVQVISPYPPCIPVLHDTCHKEPSATTAPCMRAIATHTVIQAARQTLEGTSELLGKGAEA